MEAEEKDLMKRKGTILITGGAKRIGRALALALSQEGYKIALHCHLSKKEGQALCQTINKAKGHAKLFECNLGSEAQSLKLIRQVKKECPDLCALVNNASIFKRSRISSSSMKMFHDNLHINFIAPYIFTKHFAKYAKTGSIINILDTNIVSHTSTHADYLLSKKALAQLSALSAVELAPRLRVNAVAPGLILPPKDKTQSYLTKRSKIIPLKKHGSPKHIVQAVLFLLENDFITGETIFVDGGEHLV